MIIANCGHPELLPTCSADSVPQAVGYGDIIPVDGSTITFSCLPGFILVGSNSATCMENGLWKPDTRRLMCNESKGIMYSCMHNILLGN